ncbi:hypothetical protein [Mordavella massiliensis]|uniref:Uncharacterized protein n=1 Tax=Mordavella massiliensis TaxID=1871024 RepID=A0A939BHJ9_9CLOT|nr:hypothetical protein [Mordavella massiliensis]MBM6948851.1 hypothetical protein [Mordavella massiliensis]
MISSKTIKRNICVMPILFIFSMMFSVTVAGVNTRYAVYMIWLIVSLLRQPRLTINNKIMLFPITLLILILYTTFIMSVNNTDNTFEVMRFCRGLLTYLIIFIFISSGKYNKQQIMDSLLIVIWLHSIVIILGVIFPIVKDIVMPISQYSKEFLSMRSSGFLSGFDDAGFLCNVGLIMDYLRRRSYLSRNVGVTTVIFALAAALTSRFNMLCMAMIILYIMIKELRSGGIASKLMITIIGIMALGFGIVFWILTTNVNIDLKNQLLADYPALDALYTTSLGSYTDYGVYNKVIGKHLSLNGLDIFNIFFGAGYRTGHSDIGYIKTIYSIGIVGILIEIAAYYIAIRNVLNVSTRRKIKNNQDTLFFVASTLFMFLMEAKNSLIFSSTTFEMMSIIYLCIMIKTKNINKLKFNTVRN